MIKKKINEKTGIKILTQIKLLIKLLTKLPVLLAKIKGEND